jgi:hypothetical protein
MKQAVALRESRQGVYLKPFKVFHAKMLFASIPDAQMAVIKHYEVHGEGWTLFKDGRPIAAAGVCIVVEGMGSAWGLITDEARKMPFALHRHTKKIFEEIIAKRNLRRVDMIVNPNTDFARAAMEWAERLGFEREATLKRFYADGSPALQYARTK